MESGEPGALFAGVVFSIVPRDTIDESEANDLVTAIETNGGKHVPLRSADHTNEDFGGITHIISQHIDFPDYSKALDAGVFVVKPSWAIQSIRKRRLAGARQHSPDPSQFFQDVVLSCADLPAGDVDAITAGVIALGGQFSGPLTKLVTHIATTSLQNEKCRIAVVKSLDCKIVLPHWFDDCLRLGKKISERPYTFPDPELLRHSKSAIRSYPSPQLEGATTARPHDSSPKSPPPSPSKSRKALNVFIAKKVFLSDDLQLGDRLLETLEELIRKGSGSVTSGVHDADIYVGQYRDTPEYIAASRAGKDVASLSWLYHVINLNKYTSPLTKLLHYPIPRHGIPGFENMKISVSNYSGEARIYLENLVRYCGAEYTKTMKQDNTHLIAAHMQSEKCEAAQEWNINIVNHLWIEESFAKCAVQTLSNPKYTHFPARTNLGEIAGQTVFDIKRLESMYFPKLRSPQKNQSPRKKSPAKAVTRTELEQHHQSPSRTTHDVPEQGIAAVQNGEESESNENAESTPGPNKKPRGRPPKALATPQAREEEKENEIPTRMSTGRLSKVKARDRMQEQAIATELFHKEEKRHGGQKNGSRQSEPTVTHSSPTAPKARKRPSDALDAAAETHERSDGETQHQPSKPAKRAKQTNSPAPLPPVQIRMMVTGDDRWQGKATKESADKAKLRMLGVLLTQDPKNVQVLVAPKILRTKKFVAALACAPLVVDTSYLDTALNSNKLTEEPKMLDDREAERRLGFKLSDALARAKRNKHRLFAGWTIMISKDVPGGFETYKDIIALNGGATILYTGRAGTVLPKRPVQETEQDASPTGSDDETYDYVYLVSGATAAEKRLGRSIRELAEKQGLEARIVSHDWVLNAAMRQEITWDEEWEHKL